METPVAVAVAVTATFGIAAPLASVALPKMTLVAVWANNPELNASSRTHVERRQVTVNTSQGNVQKCIAGLQSPHLGPRSTRAVFTVTCLRARCALRLSSRR